MAKSAIGPDMGGLMGWAAVGGIILLIAAIAQCSSVEEAPSNTAGLIDQNMTNAIVAQESPPPEPLNEVSVTRGVAHLRLAFAAEGFPGAMTYSQNCYDALTREFSWAKLDVCGALDMLAVASIENADPATLRTELGYFESEAAAGRYLAAAVGGGEAAAGADQRLSQLQTRIARMETVGRQPPLEDDGGEAAANESDPLIEPNMLETNSSNWLERAMTPSPDE